MRAVIQRVSEAQVLVDEKIVGAIQNGFVVFVGVGTHDTVQHITHLVNKILNIRIFVDDSGKMNLNIRDINGSLLIISQFTLYGDCKKGNRPSFINAADRVHAKKIYNEFVNYTVQQKINVQTGVFGADMSVKLINTGPATFTLDLD
jgi:D-tyrosyl-tRNA(Tyr) deacylase